VSPSAPSAARASGAALSSDGVSRLLLAAALLLGLVRFFRLGEWSLWIDEALTYSDALHGESFSNPLGYRLFAFYLTLAGDRPDEFTLRLLPAIFGWLCIPLTWWAFRPFSGARAAGAAALLVAVSSWHLYWSQTARFYTLEMALALAGSGIWLRGLRAESRLTVVAGLLVAAAACLAHPGAAFLLPALVVAPWVVHLAGMRLPGIPRPCGRLLLLLALAGALGATPWAAEIWHRWRIVKGGGTPLHFISTTGFYVTPLLGAGALAGGVLAWRRRAAFDCLVLVVCAVVLVEWVVVASLARAAAQYVFYLLPWICVLAASPLGNPTPQARAGAPVPVDATLPVLRRKLQASYMILLLLPALADAGLYFAVRHGERPRWKEAYRYVWNQREPADLIMGMEAPVGEFYLSPDGTKVRRQFHVVYLNREHPEWIDYWARHERRTWYVVNREQLEDWPLDQRRSFERLLREECRLMQAFRVPIEARDLDVLVYLRE